MDFRDLPLERQLDELAKNNFIDLKGVQVVQLDAMKGVVYLTVDGRHLARVEAKNFVCTTKMEG